MAMTKRWQSFLTKANGYVHGQVTSAPVDDPFLMQWYVAIMHLRDIVPLEIVHTERRGNRNCCPWNVCQAPL